MERTWHIGVSRLEIEHNLFARLLQQAPPDQCAAGSLYVARPDGDPLIQQLRTTLEEAGIPPRHPRDGSTERPSYTLRESREYTEAELDRFELLQLDTSVDRRLHQCSRLPTGDVVVQHDEAVTLTDQLVGCSAGYLVPERIKRMLAESGLAGIAFRPAYVGWPGGNVNPPLTEWSSIGQPQWWELTPRFRMPSLPPSVQLLDFETRVPLTKRKLMGQSVLPVEGFCDRPELRYRRGDLQRWMPREWDVAQTYEPFSWPINAFHPLICTQPFHQFCRDRGIDAQWVPVHIEE
jgi:hypothetical protein